MTTKTEQEIFERYKIAYQKGRNFDMLKMMGIETQGWKSLETLINDSIQAAIYEAYEAGQVDSAKIKYSTLISNVKGGAADEIRAQTAQAIFAGLENLKNEGETVEYVCMDCGTTMDECKEYEAFKRKYLTFSSEEKLNL